LVPALLFSHHSHPNLNIDPIFISIPFFYTLSAKTPWKEGPPGIYVHFLDPAAELQCMRFNRHSDTKKSKTGLQRWQRFGITVDNRIKADTKRGGGTVYPDEKITFKHFCHRDVCALR
jgi:hypothetical protein